MMVLRLGVLFLGFLFGLFLEAAFGQEVCELATVEWKDAVIRIKTRGHKIPDSELLIPVISVGCIRETETAVIIIHSFTDGAVDDYLVVPKNWTTKITKMVAKEADAAPKNQTDPENRGSPQTPAVAVQKPRPKVNPNPLPVPKRGTSEVTGR